MPNPITDTCHCLVRHPDKAKFLVVKHEESWAPPTLSFPQGPIEYKANMLNKGMLAKYGLKTRVLRPIVRLPNYHCIEMELASTQPSKKLAAVWVDKAEYMRTRTPLGDVPDPFELWFAEQDAGQPPVRRPPFHQPGWFNHADHWIQFQLDSLAIQVTGSVEQFRQGWTSSCLLRVPTNQGWVYFKAGYEAAPGEAALTAALASLWPQTVAQPLAIDAKRNWMLNRDFREQSIRSDLEELPAFAHSVAQLQLASHDSLDKWQALGCRPVTLENLAQFSQQPEQYRPVLQEGGGGLTDQQWSALLEALQPIGEGCSVLAEIGLPLTLVHTDFRNDNMTVSEGRHLLLDWSGTVISHPFLVLSLVFQDHRATLGNGGFAGTMSINDELYQRVIESYLQPFSALASQADLLRAVEAVKQLEGVWMMLRMIYQLEWVEAKTPHFYRQVVGVQAGFKQFINQHLVRTSLADRIIMD
ncbi:MAG: phosphotransferase [Xanthomonadales bacterium]|nr:phosphotransferase [Xanthomonadales bacterium]